MNKQQEYLKLRRSRLRSDKETACELKHHGCFQSSYSIQVVLKPQANDSLYFSTIPKFTFSLPPNRENGAVLGRCSFIYGRKRINSVLRWSASNQGFQSLENCFNDLIQQGRNIYWGIFFYFDQEFYPTTLLHYSSFDRGTYQTTLLRATIEFLTFERKWNSTQYLDSFKDLDASGLVWPNQEKTMIRPDFFMTGYTPSYYFITSDRVTQVKMTFDIYLAELISVTDNVQMWGRSKIPTKDARAVLSNFLCDLVSHVHRFGECLLRNNQGRFSHALSISHRMAEYSRHERN